MSGEEEDPEQGGRPPRPTYRDRARERREGRGGDAYEGRAALEARAARSSAEETRLLGGDEESTHLVRGLDVSLLAQVERRIGREEDRLLEEAAAAPSRANARPPAGAAGGLARGVLAAVRAAASSAPREAAPPVREAFLPARAVYRVPLDKWNGDPVPTLVHRDAPAPAARAVPARVGADVIARVRRALAGGAQRPEARETGGSSSDKEEEDDGGMDIFPDAGVDYECAAAATAAAAAPAPLRAASPDAPLPPLRATAAAAAAAANSGSDESDGGDEEPGGRLRGLQPLAAAFGAGEADADYGMLDAVAGEDDGADRGETGLARKRAWEEAAASAEARDPKRARAESKRKALQLSREAAAVQRLVDERRAKRAAEGGGERSKRDRVLHGD